jgi:hypothetical protein
MRSTQAESSPSRAQYFCRTTLSASQQLQQYSQTCTCDDLVTIDRSFLYSTDVTRVSQNIGRRARCHLSQHQNATILACLKCASRRVAPRSWPRKEISSCSRAIQQQRPQTCWQALLVQSRCVNMALGLCMHTWTLALWPHWGLSLLYNKSIAVKIANWPVQWLSCVAGSMGSCCCTSAIAEANLALPVSMLLMG